MCCVTKATSIHFIDCNIRQLKSRKSHKTCLTNHTGSMSHHIIMSLVIKALGGGHITTHRHAHIQTSETKQF